jgi:hypothetical protein
MELVAKQNRFIFNFKGGSSFEHHCFFCCDETSKKTIQLLHPTIPFQEYQTTAICMKRCAVCIRSGEIHYLRDSWKGRVH